MLRDVVLRVQVVDPTVGVARARVREAVQDGDSTWLEGGAMTPLPELWLDAILSRGERVPAFEVVEANGAWGVLFEDYVPGEVMSGAAPKAGITCCTLAGIPSES